MHYPARAGARERHTLCISSQAGCAVGCPFCATGELGMERDLETAEIVDQVRHAARRLAADGKHLTNVVFMGMGEPLLNLDRVLESIEALNDPTRFGLGARHITVSHVRRGARDPAPHRARARSSRSPSAPRGAQRRCATCSCRSTGAGRWRRWWPPPASTREATGRRVTYEVTMIDGHQRHRRSTPTRWPSCSAASSPTST